MLRYRRGSLHGVPLLFGNSFPKSGTHLLTQVLQSFTRLGPAVDSGLSAILTYAGDTGDPRPVQAILDDLNRLLPGDVAYGHLHAMPEIIAVLCREGVAPYFILRDPRDVVVSHVYYVTSMEPRHALHAHYARNLNTFDERLMASILGVPGIKFPFPDIAGRFNPYLAWMEQPQIMVLHFEDLARMPRPALASILSHATQRGFPLACTAETAIDLLHQSMRPERSPTFRSGKTGAWVEKFTSQHKEAFKSVAGDLLLRLGYEKDHDW